MPNGSIKRTHLFYLDIFLNSFGAGRYSYKFYRGRHFRINSEKSISKLNLHLVSIKYPKIQIYTMKNSFNTFKQHLRDAFILIYFTILPSAPPRAHIAVPIV